MKTTSSTSSNKQFGFYGTVGGVVNPDHAWRIALNTICRVLGEPEYVVADFLDSRHGRHFADYVVDWRERGSLQQVIERVVQFWLSSKLTGKTERDLGIPRGLSTLAALVYHNHFQAQAQRDLDV